MELREIFFHPSCYEENCKNFINEEIKLITFFFVLKICGIVKRFFMVLLTIDLTHPIVLIIFN